MGNLCCLGPDRSSVLLSAQSIAKARTPSVQTVHLPRLNLSPEGPPWGLPPPPQTVCVGEIPSPPLHSPHVSVVGAAQTLQGWRSLAEGNCLKAIPIFPESQHFNGYQVQVSFDPCESQEQSLITWVFLTCDSRGCELIGSIAAEIETETAFGGKGCELPMVGWTGCGQG